MKRQKYILVRNINNCYYGYMLKYLSEKIDLRKQRLLFMSSIE